MTDIRSTTAAKAVLAIGMMTASPGWLRKEAHAAIRPHRAGFIADEKL
jgi:hypothetical protein